MLKIKKNQSDSTSKLDNAPISTVLGSETMFTGDIQGSQTIKIDGKVKGNIQVENGVILGEKAQIEGDLKSKNIIVFGNILGNIYCNELIIKKCGTVNGNNQTKTIEIEMGRKYNGKLKMDAVQHPEKTV